MTDADKRLYNKAVEALDQMGAGLPSEIEKYVPAWIDGYQEGLKAKAEWHYPARGELPKEDKEYLVYMNDGTIDIQKITMDGDGHYYFNGISWAFNDLIAWRELPEPPKEEE